MSRRLRFGAHAFEQLEREIASLDDPRAALRLADTIERRLSRLKTLPGIGRMVPELGIDELREVIIPPFRIVYRVEPAAIRVLAVVHSRRKLESALPAAARTRRRPQH